MLTYDMEKRAGRKKYEHLYLCIRADIESGVLEADEKMPSKRLLAEHLGVGVITVEAAYRQLIAEGYLRSVERVGCFVVRLPLQARAAGMHDAERGARASRASAAPAPAARPAPRACTCPASAPDAAPASAPAPDAAPAPASARAIDLTGSTVRAGSFPFSSWSRALRATLAPAARAEVLADPGCKGCPRLRRAIAEHLRASRGLAVDPDCVVIGAGAQTLYAMLVQLLGRDGVWAVEDPGYPRLASIYRAHDVQVRPLPLDAEGISMHALVQSGARIAHLMPSHHYPTGLVTSAARRYELLGWAARGEGRYVIEDDFDCEFRLSGRPLPTLASLDADGRVVYTNTLTKSMGPQVRMAYMVLPAHLAKRFEDELGFYSTTVSTIDQLALAHAIEQGDFERHVNRSRTHARAVRDALLERLRAGALAEAEVRNKDAGLGFLLVLPDGADAWRVARRSRALGVLVRSLDDFRTDRGAANQGAASAAAGAGAPAASPAPAASVPAASPASDSRPAARSTLVIDYSALDRADVDRAVDVLEQALADAAA